MELFSVGIFGLGFFVLFPLAIVGFFAMIFIRSQKRLTIEQDKEPLYASRAGGQIGWMRYRGPFISLRVYDEFVVVSYVKTLVLRFDEIESVEIKKWMGRIPDSIQISHHQPDAPSKIIIGTADPGRVKEIIDSRLQKSA